LAPVDLSKLRIERDGSGAVRGSRGRALRKALAAAILAVLAAGAAFLVYKRVAGAAVEVEQTSVTLA
jgi:hypothetical protein